MKTDSNPGETQAARAANGLGWAARSGVVKAAALSSLASRRRLANEVIRDLPIHPINLETARVAGRIEGEQAGRGITIAFEDLLIAATAP